MGPSALYVGQVRHRRTERPGHAFQYRVWYALLDLDELAGVASQIPIFSHNRFNLASFDDRDHMRPERSPVRDKLSRWMEAQGLEAATVRVCLLAHLRVLGHAFNPLSIYYCYDSGDRLRHVVAEVHNTFGETYCYLLQADESNTEVRQQEGKVFHVSPFQPVRGRYEFRVTPPEERLTVNIEVFREGVRTFDASLNAERRPLNTGTLLGTVLRHPHIGLRTLGLIHYQAVRLWLKRAPFFRKPGMPPGAWRTRRG